jgi:homoserine kinase type II
MLLILPLVGSLENCSTDGLSGWEGGAVAIGEMLAERWGLKVERVEVLSGGMNSRAWLVGADGAQVVVKSVERDNQAFGPGLELAARLGAAGLVTGAPVPSLAGLLVEEADDRLVALLQYVDGIPLTQAEQDQDAIGTTLARVHAVSRTSAGDLEEWFDLITQFDEYLDLEPWIRPAVEDALNGVREFSSTAELTWAGLHGDPAPEAFLRQPDGEIALIDWGSFMTAPVLYDIASAVMYVGQEEHVVSAYLAERPDLSAEIRSGLPAFLRFRHAVQAAYFAWRIATDVQTGVTPDNDNAKGLSDAHRWFGA